MNHLAAAPEHKSLYRRLRARLSPLRTWATRLWLRANYPLRVIRIFPYVWKTELAEIAAFRRARAAHEHEYADPNEKPLISIIIPTYNRAELLMTRAVPSILAQTYQNFEVLIIGDHCSDDTGERIAALDDPRFTFYNLPERPPYPPDKRKVWLLSGYKAMNTGRQIARGKWLASLDDDDVWLPEHLEKLLRFAQHGNYEFASSQSLMLLPNGQTRVKGKPPALSLRDKTHCTYFSRAYLRTINYEYHAWRAGRCIDKQILGKYRRAGVRAGFLEEITAHYMLNNHGTRHI